MSTVGQEQVMENPQQGSTPELSGPASVDPRLRLAHLPQGPRWVLWLGVLCAVVLAVGLSFTYVPGLDAADFSVDQELSVAHVALLSAVAMAINLVFGPKLAVVILAAIALFLLFVRRAPVSAAAFLVVSMAGWLVAAVFKEIVARPRPDAALLFDPLAPETGSNSFPSGHVAFTVALVWALWFLARGTRWSAPVAIGGLALALVVAWSRVYMGVHYPSDVLASFPAATAGVMAVTPVWNRFGVRLLSRVPMLGRIGPVGAAV